MTLGLIQGILVEPIFQQVRFRESSSSQILSRRRESSSSLFPSRLDFRNQVSSSLLNQFYSKGEPSIPVFLLLLFGIKIQLGVNGKMPTKFSTFFSKLLQAQDIPIEHGEPIQRENHNYHILNHCNAPAFTTSQECHNVSTTI